MKNSYKKFLALLLILSIILPFINNYKSQGATSLNYIFFTTDNGIYKVKTDGSGLTQICSEPTGNGFIFDSLRGKIYYSGYNDNKLYSININGSNKTQIWQHNWGANMDDPVISNDNQWLYFKSSYYPNVLYKINLDDYQVYSNLNSINDYKLTDENIYWSSNNVSNLFRCSTTFNSNEIVLNENIGEFVISKDNQYIYYRNKSDGSLNKIKFNGTEKIILSPLITYDYKLP